jgi:hypothetical protein
VPREQETKETVDALIVSWELVYRRLFGDIAMSKDIIFVGYLVAIILGLLVIFLMSNAVMGTIWIWLSMIINMICFVIVAVFCYLEMDKTIKMRCYEGRNVYNCGGKRATTFKLLMWLFLFVGAIYLAVVLFFFKKIHLTTKIFRLSTFLYKRVWQMKSIIAMGVIAMLFITFFYLFTMISASSAGTITKQDAKIADGKFLLYKPNMLHRVFVWMDIPLVYLAYTFVISVLELMTAFSVTAWYFSRKKKEATLPTTMYMKTAIIYHIGTVCKLAIMKWGLKQIRNIAWIIKKMLRSIRQDRNWARFIIATFLPLLNWYESTLKFISKDSLINICLWGDDYNLGSKKGYFLSKIRHKEEGYGVMSFVKFILFSSKCAISILAAIFVYAWCVTQTYSPSIFDITIMDTPIVPYLFTFITCLFFTSVFFLPFDMIYRGTLQCYAIDSEMFVGDQRFTERDLQTYFDDIKRVNFEIEKDVSFCCFGCSCKKKEMGANTAAYDANVAYDEEDERKFILHYKKTISFG